MTDSCGCSPQAAAGRGSVSAPGAPACPTNQRVGRPVDSLTLKALLGVPLTALQPVEYRFCGAPDCPTVYYSADGAQVFDEAALRERVFQKHPDDEQTPVCYCFCHTIGSIRQELAATGSSTVVAQITAGIQVGACACDIRNPQGACCLGNVRRLVQQLMREGA